VGHEDIYEFRLVAAAGQPPISTENWLALRSLILELQPARSAALEGDPPRAIRIEGLGGTEVAPGLLTDLERLSMTCLRVELGSMVARPRTVMGLWLRALIMRDTALIEELGRQLNGGRSGWNDDEAGVIQAACDLAVRSYFRPGYDIRAIIEVVSFIREADQSGGRVPHGQPEMVAVIRHALGETNVDVRGINAQVAFEVQIAVTGFIAWKSDSTEQQVHELITEAEQLALSRGWDPPMAA